MKKCKYIILLMLIIVFFNTNALAISKKPYTNILSQGHYKVSEYNGDFKPGRYKFSLITPESVSYIYVIDKNCIQRFSKRYDSKGVNLKGKENYSLCTEGRLLEGDTVIIFGKGEIYFDEVKSKD